MATDKFKEHIEKMNKILESVDYYQLLKVDQMAFEDEIKKAYFEKSRLYHPDRFFNDAPEFQAQVTVVFKRVCEAYKVLSDTDKRAEYTKLITGPDRKKFLRYNPKAVEEEKAQQEDEGQTPMGQKYYQLGKKAMQNKDFKGAKINLQLAAKMEPKNATFQQKLKEVEDVLAMRKKR